MTGWGLTPREEEALYLTYRRKTPKEVAHIMGCTLPTAYKHLQAAAHKMGEPSADHAAHEYMKARRRRRRAHADPTEPMGLA